MPMAHINKTGKTYYPHQGTTKKGNPKYSFPRQTPFTIFNVGASDTKDKTKFFPVVILIIDT